MSAENAQQTVTVYIGLGSNLDSPENQLEQAIKSIAQLPATTLLARSSFYQSAAVGPAGQDDYLNAVVRVDTALSPEILLDKLQQIEKNQGRVRAEKWGARTLDLDILLYGDQLIDSVRLKVPHQHMLERNFVLLPLQEIAGEELGIPGNGLLADAIKKCPHNPIQRWNNK